MKLTLLLSLVMGASSLLAQTKPAKFKSDADIEAYFHLEKLKRDQESPGLNVTDPLQNESLAATVAAIKAEGTATSETTASTDMPAPETDSEDPEADLPPIKMLPRKVVQLGAEAKAATVTTKTTTTKKSETKSDNSDSASDEEVEVRQVMLRSEDYPWYWNMVEIEIEVPSGYSTAKRQSYIRSEVAKAHKKFLEDYDWDADEDEEFQELLEEREEKEEYEARERRPSRSRASAIRGSSTRYAHSSGYRSSRSGYISSGPLISDRRVIGYGNSRIKGVRPAAPPRRPVRNR